MPKKKPIHILTFGNTADPRIQQSDWIGTLGKKRHRFKLFYMLDYRTIFKLFYMLDYMLDYTLAILHVRLFYMLSYMLDYRISSNKHWASIKHRPLISAAFLK